MRILDALEYLDLQENVLSQQLREDLAEFLETIEYMLLNTEFHDMAIHARNWRTDHLEADHLFDQFIQSKAWEINSGDHVADYYEALRMRRDQLLALRDIYKEYLNVLSSIYSQNRDFASDIMKKFDFDTGLYLRAKDYEKARKEVIHAHRSRKQTQHEELVPKEDKAAKASKTKKHAIAI